MASVPISVTLLKYKSMSSLFKCFWVCRPYAICWAPRAPILFAYKLSYKS